jgi:hypothetical protein
MNKHSGISSCLQTNTCPLLLCDGLLARSWCCALHACRCYTINAPFRPTSTFVPVCEAPST